MTIPRIALIAAVVVVACILFDALFGTDSGGLRHDVSVAAFLASVAGLVVLAACAVVATARRLRTRGPTS